MSLDPQTFLVCFGVACFAAVFGWMWCVHRGWLSV